MSDKRRERSSLEEISIRNLGVIESAIVEFGGGLTVLTGETGAGKTMVLTALGQVLGGKSDADLVRTGSERSVVSARFSLDSGRAASLVENGEDVNDDELILTRTVSAEGKSRIHIGGAISTASHAGEIAAELIEIYGQSQSAKLLKSNYQRDLLDLFADSRDELINYQIIFEEYREIDSRLNELRDQGKRADEEIAKLKNFSDAFSKVMPIPDELSSIEQEILRLGSVEELHSTITHALNTLEDEEQPVTSIFRSVKKSLDTLREKDHHLDHHIEKFSHLALDLTDLVSDLFSYLARLEADPARFDFLQERKAMINSLVKKFGVGSDRDKALDELIARYASAKERLADLTGGDSRIAELQRERDGIFIRLKKAASLLSTKRLSGAITLSERVSVELGSLHMPRAKFACDVISRPGEVIDDYMQTGLDEVNFLFASHEGGNLLSLAKVASGGESSRVMLAIAVVLAENSSIGTYVFDEVDAGVGGAAAIEVGRRLKRLSASAQVIVVTHLAQVAVWADHHLVVHKDESGSVSASNVLSLDLDQRKVEIARMLSGQAQSKSAQEHAFELLELVQNERPSS